MHERQLRAEEEKGQTDVRAQHPPKQSIKQTIFQSGLAESCAYATTQQKEKKGDFSRQS